MALLLNGGLNHIIFLHLFLLFPEVFFGLHFRVDLWPLFPKASWYSNLVDSFINGQQTDKKISIIKDPKNIKDRILNRN